MRLLLLTALALLPLSTAIKCYVGEDLHVKGQPLPNNKPKKETACPGGSCLWAQYGGSAGITGVKRTCGDPEMECDSGTCLTNEIESGISINMCCCKGDFCNGSNTPPRSSPAAAPTVLLPLAAAAAVLAARY